MNQQRVRRIQKGETGPGPVVYWMSRDQRAEENWALLHAQQQALARQAPLTVVFTLAPEFLSAQPRHYRFLLAGLQETARQLAAKNIPLVVLSGDPPTTLAEYLGRLPCSLLVTDFDPLKPKQAWKRALLSAVTVPVDEVDAHNVVPCWVASTKQEFGAYTLRPKLRRLLADFTESYPELLRHPFGDTAGADRTARIIAEATPEVPDYPGMNPGSTAAQRQLRRFLDEKLAAYDDSRNDPAQNGQSDLSPYLHFGQLSAQRVFLEIVQAGPLRQSQEAFLEELIVRRELADNFCHYNPDYDNSKGFPAWAQETLKKHRDDRRPLLYDAVELAEARTHDPAWNAAQRQMVETGKMHGYMRMYWAKKILEWTSDPDTALTVAIALNNRYSLDGRDPNGYAGVAWSIGGVHDRPWSERTIFGKIRYMNAAGLRRKFKNLDAYIKRFNGNVNAASAPPS